MANDTDNEKTKAIPGKLPEQSQQLERAVVAPDGTITVSHGEGTLTSVDIADVDLLLSFADGSFVVVPNGALDAISGTPPTVQFSDSKNSLGNLFKMVGISNQAKAGSIRVVSGNVDAPKTLEEIEQAKAQPNKDLSASEETVSPEIATAPAPLVKVGKNSASNSGTGSGQFTDSDPVQPPVTQRPASTYSSTGAPVKTLATPSVTLANDTGSSNSDKITNDAALSVSAPSSGVIRTFSVDGVSSTNYVAPNSDGTHTVVVTDTDKEGNSANGSLTFNLDRTAPVAPLVRLAVDSGSSSSDRITNDPALAITAPASDVVVRTYSVDNGPARTSYIAPSADGNHTVVVTDVDLAGNSATGSVSFSLDRTIATPTVVLANDSGSNNSDKVTNDPTLAVSAAAADVTRTYSVDGGAAGSSYVAPNSDGSHTVVVTDTDVAGNTASSALTFSLDRTITTPALALTNDSGLNNNDRITNDASLTVSATASDVTRTYSVDGGPAVSSYVAPNADGSHTVVVTDIDIAGNTASSSLTFVLDRTIATPTVALTVDSGISTSDRITNNVTTLNISTAAESVTREYSIDGGTWNSTYTPPAVDGNHTVTVRDTDIAGNSASGSLSFTLDRSISTPTVSLATDSGSSAGDKITNNGTLIIGGIESGAVVEYSATGTSGWSTTAPIASEGANTVFVRQTDVAGNVSSSASLNFTLDTTAPIAPTVALAIDSGASPSDKITNIGVLNIGGVENGAVVEYSTTGVSGWSTTAPVVAEGTNTVFVHQTDVAGNSSASTSFTFVYDSTVVAPSIALATDSGSSSSDHITNVGTLSIGGIEAGAVVEFSATGTSGWSTGAPIAAEGVNTVFVRQIDVAGNVSASNSITYTLDTTAPLAPTVALAIDSGASAADKITNAATLALGGIESGAVVEYSVNGASGWSTTAPVASEGLNTVFVRQTDVAGNVGASTSLTFTLDRTIATPTIALAVDSGSSNSDRITSSAAVLNISAPTEPVTREYSIDGGVWNSTYAAPAVDGNHTVTVRDTDVAGNTASGTLNFTLDTSAPIAPTLTLATDSGASASDRITNVATLSTGGVENGAIVEYSATGTSGWSSAPPVASEGANTVYVRQTDVAGNVGGSSSLTFVLDRTIATPSVSLAVDSGVSSTDLITNNAALVFSATASDVSRLYSVDGGVASSSYTAPAADGTHTVVVTDTDVAGNTASAGITFTLDRTIATPTVSLTVDSGASSTDLITSNAALTFSAAASDVSRSYSVDGGAAVGSYIAPIADGSHTVVVTDTDVAGNSATGSITFTLDRTIATPTAALVADTGVSSTDMITNNAALSFSTAAGDVSRTYSVDGGAAVTSYVAPTADGNHTVVVIDTDVAGNSASGSITFTLDRTIATPVVTLANDSGASNSDLITNSPALTFSAASSDVSRTYSVDGGAAVNSYVAPSVDGNHTVVVTDTDVAGNLASGSLTFTLDTTAPVAPTVMLAVDSGSSNSDRITNNAALIFSSAAPDVTRTYSVDGGVAASSYTAPNSDGIHTVVVTDTDVAGNASNGSITFTLDHTITTPTAVLTNDSGLSNSDRITNDAAVTFSAAASDVTRTFVVDGGVAVSNYVAPNTDGNHTVVVTDTDVAGNSASGSITFTLDRTIATPTVVLANDTGLSNSDRITNDAAVSVSSAAADVTRTYSVDGGVASGSYVAPNTDGNHTVVVTDTDVAGNTANGSVTFTLDRTIAAPTAVLTVDSGVSNTDLITNNAALSFSAAAGDVSRTYSVDGGAASGSYVAPNTDGSHTVVVTDTDVAGNSASGSITFTLDRTIATPVVSLATDSGISNSDKITNDASLVFSAAAGDVTRTYIVDGGVAGNSYTAPNADGVHTVVVTDTDVAGNTASGSITFTLDHTIATPTVVLANDSGLSGSDRITNDTSLLVSSAASDVSRTYSVDGAAAVSSYVAPGSDGTHTVVVTDTDVAGNIASGSLTFTLDTMAPNPLTIALAVDSGSSSNDKISNVGTLNVGGAESGAIVEYSATGTSGWNSTAPVATEGSNSVFVRQTDVAGNISSSTNLTYTLDTTIATPVISLSTDSGLSNSDHITNNVGTLNISAPLETVVRDYNIDGGGWSTTYTIPSSDGAHTVNVRDTDVAGNSAIGSLTFTLDTVAPAAPAVSLVSDSGLSGSDKITNVSALNIGGIEANALVEYSTNGATGWSAAPPVATEGTNTVFIRQTDVAGNVSASNSITFVLDTVNPVTPAVSLALDSGFSASDKITNVTTLSIGGVESGALVEYSSNGASGWSASAPIATEGTNTVFVRQTDIAGNISSSTSFTFVYDSTVAAPVVVLATDSGSSATDRITNVDTLAVSGIESGAVVEYSANGTSGWSISEPVTVEGSNTVFVRQTDVAGNVSASTSFTFTLDTAAPSAPTVALATDSGADNSDRITNLANLNVTGLESGATVEYSATGTSGWSAALPVATEGSNTVFVRQVDVAGNPSASTSFTFTLDTTPPVTPTISLISDTGLSPSDLITKDGSLSFSATAVGVSRTFFVDGGAASNSYVVPVADGVHTVEVVDTDTAGNEARGTITFTLDNLKPVAPALSLAIDNGLNNSDKITNTATLNTTGVENGALVEYSADGNSGWDTSVPVAVEGSNTVFVRQTDVAGNVSVNNSITYTLDTIAPAAPTVALLTDSGSNSNDKITNVATLKIDGVENGALVEYSANGSTGWSINAPAVAEGSNTVFVRQTDVAGNISSSTSFTFVYDTTVLTPTVALATDSGSSASDKITNVAALTVSGIESGAVVEYSANGTSGWSITEPAAVEGANTVFVRQTDVAGNVSASTSFSYTLDTTAPVAPSVTLSVDSGSNNSDRITNVATLNVTGLESGATVEYSTNGTSGWSTTAPIAAEGSNTVFVRQIDVAGNASANTSYSFTLDTTPPVEPTISLTNDSGLSSTDHITNNVGTLNISAPVEAVVREYSIDGSVWSASYSIPGADGTHTVSVRDTDLAGNSAIGSLTFTLDRVAPVAPLLSLVTDSGLNSSDKITNTAVLTTTGVESGALVEYSTNGVSGWSTIVPVAVEGSNTAYVRQTDLAGNVSTSSSITYTLDTLAPAAPTVSLFTDSGSNSNDKITNNAALTVGGVESGALIEYSANGSTGWSVNAPAVAEGSNTVFVRQTDVAGNISTSTSFTFVYDSTVATPTVALATDSGSSPSDKITNVATVIVGNIESGAVVEYSTNGTSGWSITPPAAVEGSNTLYVHQVDVAGNISANASLTYVYDTINPVPPLVALANDTGSSSTDRITNSSVLNVTGLESGATVEYSSNGTSGWSVNTPVVSEGSNTVFVRQVDVAGNHSNSTSYTFTLDTTLATPVVVLATDSGTNTSDRITNNANFSVSGQPSDLTLREYSVDGGAWSTTQADAVITPTGPADHSLDGSHTISVRDTDVAGNSRTGTLTFTLDTTPPSAPVITSIQDNMDPVQGPVADGATTNDTTPQLFGSAELNSSVKIYDNGTFLTTVTTDGSGSWSYTSSPLAYGTSHSYTAVATDVAGNSGVSSAPYIINIQAYVAPPVITGALDDVLPSPGNANPYNVPNNGYTNDTSPMLTGTAGALQTIKIYDGGVLLGTTTALGNGDWSYTTPALNSGANHSFTATAVDGFGSVSNFSTPYALFIDTSITMPAITEVKDNFGPVQGNVNNGSTTDDTTPTLVGTSEAGATVTIFDNGVQVTTIIADNAGGWTFTPAPLTLGSTHSYTLQAADSAGNVSSVSSPYIIKIEAFVKPPVITDVNDNVDPVQGSVSNGFNDVTKGFTNDQTPTIKGTADAGNTVHIFDYGVHVTDVTVDGSGNWSYTTTTLANGTSHSFTATSENASGNVSDISASYVVNIDTSSTRPAITEVMDDVTFVTGNVLSGGSTNDPTPTISGIAEAFSTVWLYDKGVLVADSVYLDVNSVQQSKIHADVSGSWSFTTAPLANGSDHTFTIVATDRAGNDSLPSAGYLLHIDTTAPATPVVALANDSSDGAIGHNSDLRTNDATLNISTPLEPVTREYSVNGSAWNATYVGPTVDGAYTVNVRDTDAAGNISGVGGLNFILDTTVTTPVVSLAVDSSDGRPGHGSDLITNNGALVFSAASESVIRDYNVDGGGWSASVTAPTTDGIHTVQVRDMDVAGNVSTGSITYTIDTAAPTVRDITTVTNDSSQSILNNGYTNDTTPTISGVAEAGSLVTIYESSHGATPVAAVSADSGGAWSYTPTAAGQLSDGAHSYTVTATDAAGNTSTVSNPYSITIDTVISTPVITSIIDDVNPNTGNVLSVGSTNDKLPTFHGTAEAGSKIYLCEVQGDGSKLVLNPNDFAIADTNGDWIYTPATPLSSDATHNLSIKSMDAAGNVGYSAPVTLDIIPYVTTPVITSVVDDVPRNTGALVTGSSSNDATLTLSGTADKDSTVNIYDNGATTPIASFYTTDGNWSITTNALPDGLHSFTADAQITTIKNVEIHSDPTANFNVTIDTVAPAIPVITDVIDNISAGGLTQTDPFYFDHLTSGATTNDAMPEFKGTAEVGSSLFLYDGTTLLASNIAVNAAGKWDYILASPLADGAHALSFEARDAAGNFRTSASFNLTVNTAIPAALIYGIHDNVSPVQTDVISGGYTNDPNPVLFGHTVPGSKIYILSSTGSQITGYANNNLTALIESNTGSIIADAVTGDWSFKPSDALSNGAHSYQVQIKYPAGNTSDWSPFFTFTVDTIAPIAPVISTVTTNEGSHPGTVASNGNTDDRTPTLQGTAEANSIVTIHDFNGTTTTDYSPSTFSGTTWSYTPAVQLDYGSTHTYTVTITDRAGNISPTSNSYVVNIFNAVPVPVPTVVDHVADYFHPTASAGSPHSLLNSNYTNDPSPTFSGSDAALADGTIKVYNSNNNAFIGSTVVGSDGSWSYTPSTPLGDGAYSYYLVSTNFAGNLSDHSPVFTFTVDTVMPVPIVMTLDTDSSHHILSTISESGMESAILVEYNVDGGSWSSSVPSAITAGHHTVSAHQVDQAGNESVVTQLEYWYGSGSVAGGAAGGNIIGDTGDNTLQGNGAVGTHDYLYGNAGNDTITGGHGDNTFYGGTGSNIMNGGDGVNTFVAGAGSDTIHGSATSSNILDYSTSASALDVIFNSGSGTVNHGAMTDNFDHIQSLVGSNSNDTFSINVLGSLPSVLDGGGHDLAANSNGNSLELKGLVTGSYVITPLAAHLTNIDTLNINGDTVNTSLTITSQDIQHMVNNGTSSQLFVNADNGDALNISLSAGQSVTQTYVDATHTDYTIYNGGAQLAQVHWHHV
jgi:hypothetical protein